MGGWAYSWGGQQCSKCGYAFSVGVVHSLSVARANTPEESRLNTMISRQKNDGQQMYAVCRRGCAVASSENVGSLVPLSCPLRACHGLLVRLRVCLLNAIVR